MSLLTPANAQDVAAQIPLLSGQVYLVTQVCKRHPKVNDHWVLLIALGCSLLLAALVAFAALAPLRQLVYAAMSLFTGALGLHSASTFPNPGSTAGGTTTTPGLPAQAPPPSPAAAPPPSPAAPPPSPSVNPPTH